MARGILLIGESGAGKTTSCRTLDPATTFYIDCDKKGLAWRGWKKAYSMENKNYWATSEAAKVGAIFTKIDTQPEYQQVKTIVIDTLNGIMLDDEFSRMKEKNFDKWTDLAWSVYDLIGRIPKLRDDLTVVCIGHSQTDRDEQGYMFTRMKTSGKKLDKVVIESKFTTVLLAKGSEGRYVFETRANHSTCKTPMGAFSSSEIPNDMKAVIETLEAYEKGE